MIYRNGIIDISRPMYHARGGVYARALRRPRVGVSAERRVSSAKLPAGISPGERP